MTVIEAEGLGSVSLLPRLSPKSLGHAHWQGDQPSHLPKTEDLSRGDIVQDQSQEVKTVRLCSLGVLGHSPYLMPPKVSLKEGRIQAMVKGRAWTFCYR